MNHQPVSAPLRRAACAARARVTALITAPVLTLMIASSAALAVDITAGGVYDYCVGCHGKRGAGGNSGQYPRIAGLPQPYLDDQLHAFRASERQNKPMIPIFKHVRFDEEVIDLVSAHIAAMSVPDLGLWPYSPDPDALAAFDSRADYVAAGEKAYAEQCASCHGDAGQGAERTNSTSDHAQAGAPPLVAQYPRYLRKQMADFASGERTHAASESCAVPDPAKADAIVHHLVELGH